MDTNERIDAAAQAVVEQRLERAQALAQIATAQALASIAESLARIADILHSGDGASMADNLATIARNTGAIE